MNAVNKAERKRSVISFINKTNKKMFNLLVYFYLKEIVAPQHTNLYLSLKLLSKFSH